MRKVIVLTFFIVVNITFLKASSTLEYSKNNKGSVSEKDSVTDFIAKLPEIRDWTKRVFLVDTNFRVVFMIQSEPTKNSPYYWVQVGILDEIRFNPIYNFYVYVGNGYLIKFYDAGEDKVLSIEEWRKSLVQNLSKRKNH